MYFVHSTVSSHTSFYNATFFLKFLFKNNIKNLQLHCRATPHVTHRRRFPFHLVLCSFATIRLYSKTSPTRFVSTSHSTLWANTLLSFAPRQAPICISRMCFVPPLSLENPYCAFRIATHYAIRKLQPLFSASFTEDKHLAYNNHSRIGSFTDNLS